MADDAPAKIAGEAAALIEPLLVRFTSAPDILTACAPTSATIEPALFSVYTWPVAPVTSIAKAFEAA